MVDRIAYSLPSFLASCDDNIPRSSDQIAAAGNWPTGAIVDPQFGAHCGADTSTHIVEGIPEEDHYEVAPRAIPL
jgi:hypothetical protein